MSLSIFLNHSLRERARKGEECLDRGGVGEGLNRHAPGNRPTVRRARPTLVGDAVVGVRERARAARELGRFRHRWRILRMYRYVFASAMCVCARACVCVNVCMYSYIFMCIHVYSCVYEAMYVYI